MARARILKPGFFKNEGLAEVRPPESATSTPAASFAARLCYEGLWLLADRSGRLEDRPKRIKAEVFPYDDVDVEALLAELAAHGFITRYSVTNGGAYIAVLTFPKHQHPHVNEPTSTIPAPPNARKNGANQSTSTPALDSHGASTVHAPKSHGARTVRKRLDPEYLIRSLDPVVRTNNLPSSTSGRTVDRVLAANKKKYKREKTRGRFR